MYGKGRQASKTRQTVIRDLLYFLVRSHGVAQTSVQSRVTGKMSISQSESDRAFSKPQLEPSNPYTWWLVSNVSATMRDGSFGGMIEY